MPRYLIQTPAGMFYTGNEVPETVYVPRVGNPREADPVSKLVPRFDSAVPGAALKYDTEADARFVTEHDDLVDPQAFAGCVVIVE